jgi:hypothetical protein
MSVGSNPTSIQSKRLLLSQTESALMPERKQSGHREGRKPNGVDIQVVQQRGLQPLCESKEVEYGCDIKSGWLYHPGAVGA